MPADYRLHTSPALSRSSLELADALGAAVEATGRDVERVVDGAPSPAPGVIDLVVAPGERYRPGSGNAETVRAGAWSVSIGTALPGDDGFEREARYASYGGVALSIHRVAALALQRRQISARRVALGYHPGWDTWHGGAGARPVDVTFLGSLTEHRDEWLSGAGWALAGLRCDLRLVDGSALPALDDGHFVTGDARRRLWAASRAVLGVPRFAGGPFDWMAAVEAISNGCVVLSATDDDVAPLVPGRHLLQAGDGELPARAVALLGDEDRRAEMADAAYRLLREKLTMTGSVEQALVWLEASLPRRPIPPSVAPLPPAASVAAGRHPAQPAVEDVSEVAPAGTGPAAGSVLAGAHALIKRLALAEIDEIRRIESAQSLLRFGDPEHVDVVQTPAWDAARPEVSVLVSVFNYAGVVREAIDSVVAAVDVEVEIILVDDHSSDESVAVITAAIDELPDVAIRLVASAANRGVSAARDLAAAHARSDRLFVLDADNTIHPRAIRLLADALETSGAAFAYGIIERFGTRGGLLSCLPWDVPRLCANNYIDVMGLWRRSAWDAAGGFDPAMDRAGGFEDWDLLLHFADLGLRGVLVREIVGRYRVEGSSHLSMINLDTDSLRALLRTRYPRLPWPDQP